MAENWFTLCCAQCCTERAKEDFIVQGEYHREEFTYTNSPNEQPYYGVVCSKCRHKNDPLLARKERDALLARSARINLL